MLIRIETTRWVPRKEKDSFATRNCTGRGSLMVKSRYYGVCIMLAISGSWTGMTRHALIIILKVMSSSPSMVWCGNWGSSPVAGIARGLLTGANRVLDCRGLICMPCRHQKKRLKSLWTGRFNLSMPGLTRMGKDKLAQFGRIQLTSPNKTTTSFHGTA